MQSNFRATEVLIRAVPGIKFVHLGSVAEYSPLEFPKKTDESTLARPVNAYGKSKLLATELVLERSGKERILGTVLRVSNPLGPRMNPATLPGKVSEFLMNSREDHLHLGNLNAYRDFVDVRDVARATVLALARLPATSGEVINVGSGVARTARDLVDGMLKLSTRNVILHENLEGFSRSEAVNWQEMNVTKARKLLGWTAKIPWPQTLHYTVFGKA
jgi:nucleoside-diphosphate-sugar epimerase